MTTTMKRWTVSMATLFGLAAALAGANWFSHGADVRLTADVHAQEPASGQLTKQDVQTLLDQAPRLSREAIWSWPTHL